jgi:hypothetical protein
MLRGPLHTVGIRHSIWISLFPRARDDSSSSSVLLPPLQGHLPFIKKNSTSGGYDGLWALRLGRRPSHTGREIVRRKWKKNCSMTRLTPSLPGCFFKLFPSRRSAFVLSFAVRTAPNEKEIVVKCREGSWEAKPESRKHLHLHAGRRRANGHGGGRRPQRCGTFLVYARNPGRWTTGTVVSFLGSFSRSYTNVLSKQLCIVRQLWWCFLLRVRFKALFGCTSTCVGVDWIVWIHSDPVNICGWDEYMCIQTRPNWS